MISRLMRIFRRSMLPPECEEVRSLSSDYLDGDLEPLLMQKIREHISGCELCVAFVNTLAATVGLLRAAPARKAPSGFKERVRQSAKNG